MNPLLNKIITETKRPAFLIGAGVSVSSGIKAFRGIDGHWVDGYIKDPLTFATYRNYSINRLVVWEWYEQRRQMVLNATPNKSHYVLNHIIENDLGFIINQNVDGFIENSLEVHGNLHYTVCEFCKTKFKIARLADLETCPNCKETETLRPNILFFDESYQNEIIDTIYNKMKNCDTLFIVGTSNSCTISSLTIQLSKTLQHKIKIVEINIEPNLDGKENYFTMESDEFFENLYKIKYKI